MPLAYLGTSDFAATVLKRLAASEHRPALVVTPPDRKQGRGRKLSPPPVAQAAEDLGLDLHQATDVNSEESIDALEAAGADIAMVCAFGQIIRPALLERLELLNVHPSLLPRWRGAAPIERALMAGDSETGVAIIRLTEGLDSGPVALVESTPIAGDDDYGTLAERLAELGGELAVRSLSLRAEGRLHFTEQAESGVTYAEKIEAEDRRLDPSRPAVELELRVRALNPHIGTFVALEGDERLGVVAARAEDQAAGQPGLIDADGRLHLQTTAGVLRIDTVKPPGKGAMPASEYLRGNPVPRLAA